MKHLLWGILLLLFCYGCGNDSAGTATDVNSGSLSGILENNGSPYQESIDLYLRESESGAIIKHQVVTDGTYGFDSITFGTYDLVASIEDNSVTLGYEEKVYIEKGYTADIPVKRIIRKGFHINSDNRASLEIDLPQVSNVHTTLTEPNTVLLTFAEREDTLTIPLTYTLNEKRDSLSLRMVRELNQSYTIEFTADTHNLQLINQETALLTGDGSDSSTIIIDGIIE